MIIKIILISVFLILSALTSGCEVAFFSLDKAHIPEDNNNKLIKKIEALLEKPKRLLATILISNNFINIAIVILFASIDNPYLSSINNPIIETLIEVGVIGMLILFIGDMYSDMQSAKEANCHYLHFLGGYEKLFYQIYGGEINSLLQIEEYLKWY